MVRTTQVYSESGRSVNRFLSQAGAKTPLIPLCERGCEKNVHSGENLNPPGYLEPDPVLSKGHAFVGMVM